VRDLINAYGAVKKVIDEDAALRKKLGQESSWTRQNEQQPHPGHPGVGLFRAEPPRKTGSFEVPIFERVL
jgi:hypothetical protein